MQYFEAVTAYLDHLAAEGRPHNTVESYGYDLRVFGRWLVERGVEAIAAVTVEHVRDYLKERTADGLSVRSTERHVASVRQCFRWLVGAGALERYPFGSLETPVYTRREARFLTAVEVASLLAAPTGPTSLRDRALMLLMLRTGIRVSEAVELTTDRLELGGPAGEGAWVTVFGQNRRPRTLPLPPDAAAALRRHLGAGAGLEVFPDLNRFEVVNRIQRLGEEAGLGDRVTPQVLRHTFAQDVRSGGAKPLVLQRVLGLRSPEAVTSRYRLGPYADGRASS